MDTHVKEGQLYVQHQKFGKVSPWKEFKFHNINKNMTGDSKADVLSVIYNVSTAITQ